jgi:hypothetical protein
VRRRADCLDRGWGLVERTGCQHRQQTRQEQVIETFHFIGFLFVSASN